MTDVFLKIADMGMAAGVLLVPDFSKLASAVQQSATGEKETPAASVPSAGQTTAGTVEKTDSAALQKVTNDGAYTEQSTTAVEKMKVQSSAYSLAVKYVPERSAEQLDAAAGSIRRIYLCETDTGDQFFLYGTETAWVQTDLDSFLSKSYDIFETITMEQVVIPGAPYGAALGL